MAIKSRIEVGSGRIRRHRKNIAMLEGPTGLTATDISALCAVNLRQLYSAGSARDNLSSLVTSVAEAALLRVHKADPSGVLPQRLRYQACMKNSFYVFVYTWRWLYSWAAPLYVIFGTVGTTLCLAVLIRRRTTQREIRNWFIALSLSDIYVLLMGLSLMYIRRVNLILPGAFEAHWDLHKNNTADPMDLDPKGYNSFACYSISILNYFGLLTSSWLQAGISVLRALSTILPLTVGLKGNFIFTKIIE